MKILYQSYVNSGIAEPYLKHLSEYLNRVKRDDTEIVLGELDPPDSYAHSFVEYACGYNVVKRVYEAEQAGFDAVILGHFQDVGLEEAKSVVDIPVLGLGEISLLFACTLARHIGLVTINPRFIPVHEAQIARMGLQSRVRGIKAISFQPGELTAALGDREASENIARSFNQQAQPLVDAGADIIIPAGGIPMLMLGMISTQQISGAPVLNAIPVLIKHAEMAVELAKLNGFHISRAGQYALPPAEVIKQFIEP